MRLESRLYIFGSYEAVCEAAMPLWRSTSLSEPSSPGIRHLNDETHPGLHVLEVRCAAITGSSGAYCEALSKMVPSVLVGHSVVGYGVQNNLRDDQCFWGGSAFIDGVEILTGMTGSHKAALPPHIARLVDDSVDAGTLPVSNVEEYHAFALESCGREAAARVSKSAEQRAQSGMTLPGYPRWSLLTHQANSQGLDGMRHFVEASLGGKAPAHHTLVMEAAQAHRCGIASWADTLFFGSRTTSDDEDGAAAYATAESRAATGQALAVCAELGQDESPFSDAVLTALAMPTVSFQDDLHPAAWLAELTPTHPDALNALRRIADAVGQTTLQYEEDHKGQAIAAFRTSGFSHQAFRVATRMGTSPGLLLSRSLSGPLASDATHVAVAGKLFDCLLQEYGSFASFPPEVARTFENAHPAVAAAFSAKKTEEQMRDAIHDWKAASRTPATVPVVTRRRRTLL